MMELIKINPNNKKFYSEDFIKGFECGAKRQLEADKAERTSHRWIDANTMVTVQLYDDENEEFTIEHMTIAEYLDRYTEEGCP